MSSSEYSGTGNVMQIQMVLNPALQPVIPDSSGQENHTVCQDSIEKSLSQEKAPTFALFSRLPPELREKIWKIASNAPKLVEGRYDYRTGVWSSANVPPSVLHTCYESRRVALMSYQLAFRTFTNSDITPRLWLNDKCDMLYINKKTFFWHHQTHPPPIFSEVQCLIIDMRYWEMRRIRRLAVDFSTESYVSDILCCFYVHNDSKTLLSTLQGTTTDPTSSTRLAGGNLTGINQLPNLEELMVLIDPRDKDHSKWTGNDVRRHIHYRLEMYTCWRSWTIPKLIVAWKRA